MTFGKSVFIYAFISGGVKEVHVADLTLILSFIPEKSVDTNTSIVEVDLTCLAL